MSLSDRFALFPVPGSILSSYNNRPLVATTAGKAPPDVIEALVALIEECPWLRITELWRSIAAQMVARAKYEQGLKTAYVAIPGKSMHNCARAMDVNIQTLRDNLGPQYLDKFWPIAAKYGFTPVISHPTEGASESWHFDHKGIWQRVFDVLGYEQGVLAANCAANSAGPFQSSERRVQAHIVRLDKNIGEIDGNLGPRSRAALLELGIARPLVDATKPTTSRVQAMAQVWEILETL